MWHILCSTRCDKMLMQPIYGTCRSWRCADFTAAPLKHKYCRDSVNFSFTALFMRCFQQSQFESRNSTLSRVELLEQCFTIYVHPFFIHVYTLFSVVRKGFVHLSQTELKVLPPFPKSAEQFPFWQWLKWKHVPAYSDKTSYSKFEGSCSINANVKSPGKVQPFWLKWGRDDSYTPIWTAEQHDLLEYKWNDV